MPVRLPGSSSPAVFIPRGITSGQSGTLVCRRPSLVRLLLFIPVFKSPPVNCLRQWFYSCMLNLVKYLASDYRSRSSLSWTRKTLNRLKQNLNISDRMRSKAGTSKEHVKKISKLLPFFGLPMQLESLNKLCLDFQQTVFIVLYIYSHVISQQLLNLKIFFFKLILSQRALNLRLHITTALFLEIYCRGLTSSSSLLSALSAQRLLMGWLYLKSGFVKESLTR